MYIATFAGKALSISTAASRRRRKTRADLNCELLEVRSLLSADLTTTSPSEIAAHTNLDVLSAVSSEPSGLSPAEIKDAYGINLIAFSGGAGHRRRRGRNDCHCRRLQRPQYRRGPRRVRPEIWSVRSAVVHGRQPGRHSHGCRLGTRNVARCRVGPRHRSRRQHHSGRGCLEQPLQSIQRGQFRGPATRGHRGVDELGIERVRGRVQL